MSERFISFIVILCTVEQFAALAGTAYLVERGWSPWWFLFTFFLLLGMSPSLLVRVLSKAND